MKVLFFTLGDETIASSRTRVLQYLPHLKKQGIQYEFLRYTTGWDYRLLTKMPTGHLQHILIKIVLKMILFYHYFYSKVQMTRLLMNSYFVDVVFIQKVLLPIPVQNILRRINSRIVFDFDDALYANEKSYSKQRLEAQMRLCKLVVLENENTETYAKQFGVPALRITGPIDCSRYHPAPESPLSLSREFVVGWIGSRSTTEFLELIRKPLQEAAAKHPHIVLDLIGAGPFDIPGVRIRHSEWHLESEVNLLHRFDVGLMPLADNDFTKGKGGYKLLQYMAIGIPSIASPVGVNSEILLEGKTGFLCGDEKQWLSAMDRLMGDANLRKAMGEAARSRAVELFSYEVCTPKLVEALGSV